MDFAKDFARFYEKNNNTLNIRRLVDESFVPSAHQTSLLYCRLTDFWSGGGMAAAPGSDGW